MTAKKYWMSSFFAGALALAGGTGAAPYVATAKMCDGFPQVPVVTAPGMCLGLVEQKSAEIPLKMPRTLVEMPEGKLLVIDMGGWNPNKGKLWLVDLQARMPNAKVLLSNLTIPHKILQGPKGDIYFSEGNRISRFRWTGSQIVDQKVVIDNLPYNDHYLHPLKNFTFDRDNNLIVNIGSSSDRCEKSVPLDNCLRGDEASVRRYKYNQDKDNWDSQFEIIARGLRNSMVLLSHSSGTILQAENSIDFPDANEPYEEINVIGDGGFFGWPLCYDRNAALAGGACTAKDYREPWTLLPPHVAPLDAIYYQGNKFPNLKNQLLMSWHGYRANGNRLVAFVTDNQGRPVRQEKAEYLSAPLLAEGDYVSHGFSANGGAGLVAQHTELISQWHAVEGVRPKGSPVGLAEAKDGSIYVLDDRSGAILRLSKGENYQAPPSKPKAIPVGPSVPAAVREVFETQCAKCHTELAAQPGSLLNSEHWLAKTDGITKLETKVFKDKTRPMPPNEPLPAADRQTLRDWLDTL